MKRTLIGMTAAAAMAISLSAAPGCGGAGSVSSTDLSEARGALTQAQRQLTDALPPLPPPTTPAG